MYPHASNILLSYRKSALYTVPPKFVFNVVINVYVVEFNIYIPFFVPAIAMYLLFREYVTRSTHAPNKYVYFNVLLFLFQNATVPYV